MVAPGNFAEETIIIEEEPGRFEEKARKKRTVFSTSTGVSGEVRRFEKNNYVLSRPRVARIEREWDPNTTLINFHPWFNIG